MIINNGQKSRSLKQLCKDIFSNYEKDMSGTQRKIGQLVDCMSLQSVADCLARFSLVDPELSHCLDNQGTTDSETREYHHKLKETSIKVYLLRGYFLLNLCHCFQANSTVRLQHSITVLKRNQHVTLFINGIRQQ
jgi:hypothetical protein